MTIVSVSIVSVKTYNIKYYNNKILKMCCPKCKVQDVILKSELFRTFMML